METTAKVDIQKLQLLNDRINQCVDVLNRLRLSVHGVNVQGMQHTPASSYASPFAQTPLANVGIMGAISPTPFAQPIAAQTWGIPSAGIQGQAIFGQAPIYGGLSHTSPFVVADPYLATARYVQTFPYLFSETAPLVAF